MIRLGLLFFGIAAAAKPPSVRDLINKFNKLDNDQTSSIKQHVVNSSPTNLIEGQWMANFDTLKKEWQQLALANHKLETDVSKDHIKSERTPSPESSNILHDDRIDAKRHTPAKVTIGDLDSGDTTDNEQSSRSASPAVEDRNFSKLVVRTDDEHASDGNVSPILDPSSDGNVSPTIPDHSSDGNVSPTIVDHSSDGNVTPTLVKPISGEPFHEDPDDGNTTADDDSSVRSDSPAVEEMRYVGHPSASDAHEFQPKAEISPEEDEDAALTPMHAYQGSMLPTYGTIYNSISDEVSKYLDLSKYRLW